MFTAMEGWERKALVFRAVVRGSTYKDAGAKLGVSDKRARQMYTQMARICCNFRYFDPALDARTFDSSLNGLRANPEPWLRSVDRFLAAKRSGHVGQGAPGNMERKPWEWPFTTASAESTP